MNVYFQNDTEEAKIDIKVKLIFILFIAYWIWQFLSFDTTVLKKVDMKPFSEPIQVNIENGKPFEKKIPEGVVTITPLAEYKLYGRVMDHHYRPPKLGIAAVYPYDILIGFGAFEHKEVYKAVNVKMASTVSYISYSGSNWNNHLAKYFVNSENDIFYYFTNNHLCPANKNVRLGLKKLKKKDIVYIEGYLMKFDYKRNDGWTAQGVSSTSRNDTFRGDNGSGNCEQIYVTRVVSRYGEFK